MIKSKTTPFLVALIAAFSLLGSGCNLDNHFYSSGIVKSWAKGAPVSCEMLVTDPGYYFQDLDQDMGSMVWLLIPRGKLLKDARYSKDIKQVQTLLQDYITLLETLPDSGQLPEYQLAQIYHGLATDLDAYLDNKQTMLEITTRLTEITPIVNELETRLQEADSRRLPLLLQTFHHSALASSDRLRG